VVSHHRHQVWVRMLVTRLRSRPVAGRQSAVCCAAHRSPSEAVVMRRLDPIVRRSLLALAVGLALIAVSIILA
jgi:hypothetical protein